LCTASTKRVGAGSVSTSAQYANLLTAGARKYGHILDPRPVIEAVLKHRKLTIAIAVIILGISIFPATQIGSEFMPTLNEGTLFYMPVTLPGISVTKAAELLGVSQPTLSKQIHTLEATLGAPLFERVRGDVTLSHVRI